MSTQPPNEALRDLAALLGDTATREIVRMFLDDFPPSIGRIASSGAEDQLRIAHGLKSSALHMGADALSRRMAALEDKLSRLGGQVTPVELAEALADFEAFAGPLRQYASG